MGAGEHLAAIDHSTDIKALIDPATQARLAERHRRRKPKTFNGFIFLDGGGAYVLPVDAGAGLNGDADEQVAQDQGQDQGQVQSAPQERAQAQQELQQQEQLDAGNARLAEEQSASLPDEGEFTLILRSGQEIEAVAFTRVDDRIVYVTVGGGRRTVAVRDVDVDATVRLNQERGTPLQISL
jgi:septum formation inhibitor MinC